MELTFQYFVFVKLAIALATIYTGYKAFKKFTAKEDRKWNHYTILFVVFLLLSIYSPIKMDLNTKQQTSMANHTISQQKELPPRITDDSFNQSVNSVEGITEQDLP